MINKVLTFICAMFMFTVVVSPTTWASGVQCVEKDVSIYQWGYRHKQALPAELAVEPNYILERCIKLIGIGKYPFTLKPDGYQLSVNGVRVKEGSTVQINDNDYMVIRTKSRPSPGTVKMVRLSFKETNPEMRREYYGFSWQIQTKNESLIPTVWEVGSDKQFKQVAEVTPKVKAGDIIILNKGEQFEPFDIKNISGTAERPITLTSNAKLASERPLITGAFDKYGWTVAVRHSHFWSFKNLEIANGRVCFRNEAHGTTLEDVFIHDCHIGVMGTDDSSGSLTILHSEVTRCGGKGNSKTWGHAIYVASDQHAFPSATFTLINSYLHDNKGNNVKSRFERSYIKRNWIEGGEEQEARYLIELIGYDGAYDFNLQKHQVLENYLIHKATALGSRVGGDGNSPSRGVMLFSDNIFIVGENFDKSIVRTFQGLGEIILERNTIAYSKRSSELILLVDEVENDGWVKETPSIKVRENVLSKSIVPVRTLSGNVYETHHEISIKDNFIFPPLILTPGFLEENSPQTETYIPTISLH